jgi:phosphorylcholine metabolism protein LicD
MFVKHYREFPMEPLGDKYPLPVLLEGLKHIKRPAWISAGTLLGLERDNGFIPNDTDLDVAVFGHEIIELPDTYELIRTATDHEGRRHQQAFLHLPTQIIFDCFHYYPYDEKTYYTENEHGRLYRSREILDNMTQKEYLGHTFNVPQNIDQYLTEWYNDWRTPRQEKTIWVKE